MDREIEYLIQHAMDEKRFRRMRRNGLFLSDAQIELLERNHIHWNLCTSYRDLVSEIELRLASECNWELDDLSYMLQEQVYYRYTNK